MNRPKTSAPLRVLLCLPTLLAAAPALAQTTGPLPVGDGLQAIYYDGPNFERPLVRRRDANIDFDWGQGEPAPGVSVEQFSVRWQGWLLPPVSGRYVLHVTVDDGMRVWLNDQLVLNEWRPQRVSNFAVAVPLVAGKPYKLRVEYFQDILDTRARLTWTLPGGPKPEPETWRNGWGLAGDKPQPAPVPSRFLFTRNPGDFSQAPSPAARPAPARPGPVAVARPAPAVGPTAGGPAPSASPGRTVRTPPPPAPRPTTPAPPDSVGRQRVAALAAGQEMTLPELRFEQGKACLLPAARAALDALLPALLARPALRLEVQGHTDDQGVAELNRQLSQQRADTVAQYLTRRGVAADRLRAVGYGGTRPAADNANPALRPRNRRVVLRQLSG